MTEATAESGIAGAKKLNLGCGEFKKQGFVNVDRNPRVDPDVVHDLNAIPYPFGVATFDFIEADHVLEHLHDPLEVMCELHRIMKPAATIVVRVPHCSRGFTHSDHKRGFDVSFPLYFHPQFRGGYMGVPFEHVSTRMTWFAQKYLKRAELSPFQYTVGRALGVAFDFFARLSPFACSRLWCYWVGGFEEVEFRLRKPADG